MGNVGRPKVAEPKARFIAFRLTAKEWDVVKVGAALDKKSVSEFLRDLALPAARAHLRDSQARIAALISTED